jgi:hypothetical protein
MTFELDADGVRLWCSSRKWTRKLVERGARLVDPAQAVDLDGGGESPGAVRSAAKKKKRQPSRSARNVPRAR